MPINQYANVTRICYSCLSITMVPDTFVYSVRENCISSYLNIWFNISLASKFEHTQDTRNAGQLWPSAVWPPARNKYR